MMFSCHILPSGNLQIVAYEDGRGWLAEKLKHSWGEDLIHEILEPYWTNGGFEPFNAGDANPFVGLTCAPCIAESLDVLDDGTRELTGRLWWYPDYAIRDFAEELLRDGETLFKLAA